MDHRGARPLRGANGVGRDGPGGGFGTSQPRAFPGGLGRRLHRARRSAGVRPGRDTGSDANAYTDRDAYTDAYADFVAIARGYPAGSGVGGGRSAAGGRTDVRTYVGCWAGPSGRRYYRWVRGDAVMIALAPLVLGAAFLAMLWQLVIGSLREED